MVLGTYYKSLTYNSVIKKNALVVSLVLIAIGIFGRLLPHVWNATPIAAIALFASAYLGVRYSFVITIIVMAISDFFIGGYDWHVMLSVYASLILACLVGSLLKNKKPWAIFFASVASSAIFFLVTNWAVWRFGAMYPADLSGLIQSYTMAIPFFKNTLAGDILYSGMVFGAYQFGTFLVTKLKKNWGFKIVRS